MDPLSQSAAHFNQCGWITSSDGSIESEEMDLFDKLVHRGNPFRSFPVSPLSSSGVCSPLPHIPQDVNAMELDTISPAKHKYEALTEGALKDMINDIIEDIQKLSLHDEEDAHCACGLMEIDEGETDSALNVSVASRQEGVLIRQFRDLRVTTESKFQRCSHVIGNPTASPLSEETSRESFHNRICNKRDDMEVDRLSEVSLDTSWHESIQSGDEWVASVENFDVDHSLRGAEEVGDSEWSGGMESKDLDIPMLDEMILEVGIQEVRMEEVRMEEVRMEQIGVGETLMLDTPMMSINEEYEQSSLGHPGTEPSTNTLGSDNCKSDRTRSLGFSRSIGVTKSHKKRRTE